MKRPFAAVASVVLLATAPALADPSGLSPQPAADPPLADMIANVEPSVVRVISVQPPAGADPAGDKTQAKDDSDNQPVAFGSGFIIDPSGLILTNRHVVQNAVSIFIAMPDGARFRAQVVGMPEKADIALLRIKAGRPLPALHFGDSDKLRAGDTVIAIGSPFGLDETVTAGIVSAVNRNIMESPFDEYIQTDAAINHGNSGGPLFDRHGDVVGMNSVIIAPGKGSVGVGFAIPSEELSFVVSRIEQFGSVKAGMLPIRTQQVTAMLAQAIGAPGPGGALVAALEARGGLMNGAIQPGDVIETFDGETVWDPRDLARKAARRPIGSDVTLGICRAGKVFKVVAPILPVDEKPEPLPGQSPPPTSLGLRPTAAEQTGVTIAGIDPAGSAADSGLQTGDVIMRVEEDAVSTPEQTLKLLMARAATNRPYAALLVRRNSKDTWIPIALPG
jgi:serine protease Do